MKDKNSIAIDIFKRNEDFAENDIVLLFTKVS